MTAHSAKRIFTGETWLTDHVILTEGDLISDVIPMTSLPRGRQVVHYDNVFLSPAFIDLQIYGASGKLLAVQPGPEALSSLYDYCRAGGAAYCLPTVATNRYDVFYRCIDAVREYWSQNGRGILGLHIEGPWISEEKRGAHIAELVHAPSMKQVADLLEYGKGVIRMITLAPEVCEPRIIEFILSKGVVVSAGHSNASYAAAIQGFSLGITAVTHLYNAMSPMLHREPGLVGAAFDSNVFASIIPDGYHVDFAAVRIAQKMMRGRLFAITDAVTDTSEGFYPHERVGDKYESKGILSGSALNMARAYFNLVAAAGIEKDEALRMCSALPARIIKKDHELGLIQKGYRFAVAAIDEQNNTATLLS